MSIKRLSSLSDYARHGYELRLDCNWARGAVGPAPALAALPRARLEAHPGGDRFEAAVLEMWGKADAGRASA